MSPDTQFASPVRESKTVPGRLDKSTGAVAGGSGVDADIESILVRGRPQLPPRETVERALRAVWNRKTGAAFYAGNRSRLYAYALKVMRDHAHAEDALSQTLVEFLEGRTDAQFFPSALRGNCENLHRRLSYQAKTSRPLDCFTETRGLARRSPSSRGMVADLGSVSGDNRDPLDILLRSEAAAGDEVRELLERLSPRTREVLHLILFEGMEFSAVAARLGMSVATVRVLVFNARKYFRSRGVNVF